MAEERSRGLIISDFQEFSTSPLPAILPTSRVLGKLFFDQIDSSVRIRANNPLFNKNIEGLLFVVPGAGYFPDKSGPIQLELAERSGALRAYGMVLAEYSDDLGDRSFGQSISEVECSSAARDHEKHHKKDGTYVFRHVEITSQSLVGIHRPTVVILCLAATHGKS